MLCLIHVHNVIIVYYVFENMVGVIITQVRFCSTWMTQNYPKFVYSFNARIYFQNISLQGRMRPLYKEFNFKQLTNM